MNSYYELMKSYPNCPPIGTIVSANMNEYYIYQPHKWTEYWQEKQIGDVICITMDDMELKEGEVGYLVRDKGKVSSLRMTNQFYNSKYEMWSTYELADKAAVDAINLPIHNDIIKGEDVPVYGVLMNAGASYQEEEMTSRELFYRYSRSDKWKFFRTKEQREEYIFENKQRFSFNNLVCIIKDCSTDSVQELKDYIKENYTI